MSLTCAVVTDPTDALFEEWRELHQRAGHFPFSHPVFFRAWWRHIGSRAGYRPHIATVRENGALVGLAAHAIKRQAGFRLLQWGGINQFGYCDALTASQRARDALWATVRASKRYDVALIKSLHQDGETFDTLRGFCRLARTDTNFFADTAATDSTVWSKTHFTSHARKHFRNMENRIRAGGTTHIHIALGDPAHSETISRLVALKAAWSRTHRLSNIFDDAEAAGLIIPEISECFASAGKLFVAYIKVGEQIISVLYGMQHGETLYLLFNAYDPEWNKHSPGRLLLYKTLCWAVDHGIVQVDFMRGNQEYKTHFGPIASRTLSDFTFASTTIGMAAERIAYWLYLTRRNGQAPVAAEPAVEAAA